MGWKINGVPWAGAVRTVGPSGRDFTTLEAAIAAATAAAEACLFPVYPAAAIYRTPVMTAVNAPSPFTVYESSKYSATYAGWKCFSAYENGNDNVGGGTRWNNENGAASAGQWVTLDFGEGKSAIITGCRIHNYPTAGIHEFKVRGSNDGPNTNMVDVYASGHVDQTAAGTQTYTFSNTTAYRYWQILVVSGYAANNLSVHHISFTGTGDGLVAETGRYNVATATIRYPTYVRGMGDLCTDVIFQGNNNAWLYQHAGLLQTDIIYENITLVGSEQYAQTRALMIPRSNHNPDPGYYSLTVNKCYLDGIYNEEAVLGWEEAYSVTPILFSYDKIRRSGFYHLQKFSRSYCTLTKVALLPTGTLADDTMTGAYVGSDVAINGTPGYGPDYGDFLITETGPAPAKAFKPKIILL